MTNVTSLFVHCHCAPTDQCPNSASNCSSTTGCFHSVTLDQTLTHVSHEQFGCFPNNTNQVDLHCRELTFVNLMVYCCTVSDGNFCNANLAPPMPSLSTGRVHRIISNHASTITATILLPLLTLITGLIAIALFWHFVLRVRLKRQLAISSGAWSAKHDNTDLQWTFALTNLVTRPSWRSRLHGNDNRIVTPACDERDEENIPLGFDQHDPHELLSCTSGSGSGQPFLVQRTIARHIQLQACVGKGRFGEVWRALCQGETVAVKIFSSRDEASWARETDVYNTGLLNHPNLLAYFASDMISRSGCTQLWLITAYHANGSLHDYLNSNTLETRSCIRLARSIAAGLSFLHTEIRGLQAKPAIVHRDIKSKNVLVRDNLEACLADLGLALVSSKPVAPNVTNAVSNNTIATNSQCSYGVGSGTTNSDYLYAGLSDPCSIGPPPAVGPRVGTKRYMAPELLMAVDVMRRTVPPQCVEDTSFDTTVDPAIGIVSASAGLSFDVYQAADVYAMSLVIWEILRCTRGSQSDDRTVEGYQIPFQDMVPTDPTFAQMRQVVCAGHPQLPSIQPNIDSSSLDGDEKSITIGEDKAETSNQSIHSRPTISPRWLADPWLSRLVSLVQECWHADWLTRLPALRVRKTLESLETSARGIL